MANEVAGYIGLSRLTSLQRHMDVVTNNVANMNTDSFKAERTIFQEHLESLGGPGNSEDQSYVIDIGTYRDLKQGALQETGNPLDIAIQGEGWFSYMSENGPVYGRGGRLMIDDFGRMVTSTGDPILDLNGGEIVLPIDGDNQINIAGDGTVSVDGAAMAQIGIVEFENPQQLERMGNGYYQAPEDDFPLPAFDASVVQGMVETSNVEPIVEMTRLMDLHRAYEMTNKLHENSGELQSKMINRIGQMSR